MKVFVASSLAADLRFCCRTVCLWFSVDEGLLPASNWTLFCGAHAAWKMAANGGEDGPILGPNFQVAKCLKSWGKPGNLIPPVNHPFSDHFCNRLLWLHHFRTSPATFFRRSFNALRFGCIIYPNGGIHIRVSIVMGLGVPQARWMVDFKQNPKITWMIWR